MAHLYGQQWDRASLLRHVGDIEQVAGVRLAELGDGPGRGVRVADVVTGGGLVFSVLIDRGLDVGAAHLDGVPLGWQSSTGITHPSLYEADGSGWLRSFGGGLLATCGLTSAGAPSTDRDGYAPMHGRAANLPARLHTASGRWQGDEYILTVSGSTRETAVFGTDLMLTRTITTTLGARHLHIADRIENMADAPAPFMLLYHCNFGFPLVAEGSTILIDAEPIPRDAAAEAGISQIAVCNAPTSGYAEQVFSFHPRPDADGMATATIQNASGLRAYVRYRTAELPNLVLWRQFGVGTYVVGLEPANCLTSGRAAERERGTLRVLQPGEVCETLLEIGAATR